MDFALLRDQFPELKVPVLTRCASIVGGVSDWKNCAVTMFILFMNPVTTSVVTSGSECVYHLTFTC